MDLAVRSDVAEYFSDANWSGSGKLVPKWLALETVCELVLFCVSDGNSDLQLDAVRSRITDILKGRPGALKRGKVSTDYIALILNTCLDSTIGSD